MFVYEDEFIFCLLSQIALNVCFYFSGAMIMQTRCYMLSPQPTAIPGKECRPCCSCSRWIRSYWWSAMAIIGKYAGRPGCQDIWIGIFEISRLRVPFGVRDVLRTAVFRAILLSKITRLEIREMQFENG